MAFADEANITTTARQQSDTQMPPVKKRKIIDVSAGDAQLDWIAETRQKLDFQKSWN